MGNYLQMIIYNSLLSIYQVNSRFNKGFAINILYLYSSAHIPTISSLWIAIPIDKRLKAFLSSVASSRLSCLKPSEATKISTALPCSSFDKNTESYYTYETLSDNPTKPPY